ncbi:ciliogenesis and planar polarity effector 2 isoform X3 [Anolis carolinensis]|uniref:ciliogenesis and planar polarity effector 2 isoform X3 n=1 Tax=Anolis carolinensis TaxID=28377 RepID=UPI002F2B5469
MAGILRGCEVCWELGLLERPVLPPQAAVDVVGYKVFVSGRSGVGKTALVAQVSGAEVPSAHQETPGIQTTTVFWPAKLRESGRALFFRFSFWDCGEAALKRFDHILPSCLEKADAVLLLFSFADRASFEDLPRQANRVAAAAAASQSSGRAPLQMVVGTKSPGRLCVHMYPSLTFPSSRFDQFAHSDMTEGDLSALGHSVLRVKSLAGRRAGLSEVAPLLNGLAEHLWRQDQADAGLLPLDTE